MGGGGMRPLGGINRNQQPRSGFPFHAGTSRQQVITPGDYTGQRLAQLDIPPADLHDPFGAQLRNASGIDTPNFGDYFQSLTTFPPSGLPGSLQGPTQIPTFFDPQGYPYAVPAGGWGDPSSMPQLWHAGQFTKPK